MPGTVFSQNWWSNWRRWPPAGLNSNLVIIKRRWEKEEPAWKRMIKKHEVHLGPVPTEGGGCLQPSHLRCGGLCICGCRVLEVAWEGVRCLQVQVNILQVSSAVINLLYCWNLSWMYRSRIASYSCAVNKSINHLILIWFKPPELRRFSL